jgi:hypothetical protein
MKESVGYTILFNSHTHLYKTNPILCIFHYATLLLFQRWAGKLCKTQIRNFLSSYRCRKILSASLEMANPQICMIYPQIANPQILTKYSTTLSQNSRLFPISLCYTLK